VAADVALELEYLVEQKVVRLVEVLPSGAGLALDRLPASPRTGESVLFILAR
jgi:hypothetical protein